MVTANGYRLQRADGEFGTHFRRLRRPAKILFLE
jgi:hypothetical protein